MDSKEMLKVWRTIRACAFDDKTRTIGRVNVASATRIEATDGHMLIRWESAVPHGLAVGQYDLPACRRDADSGTDSGVNKARSPQ